MSICKRYWSVVFCLFVGHRLALVWVMLASQNGLGRFPFLFLGRVSGADINSSLNGL